MVTLEPAGEHHSHYTLKTGETGSFSSIGQGGAKIDINCDRSSVATPAVSWSAVL